MNEQKSFKSLETLVSRYIKLNMSEEEEVIADNFDLCMGTKSTRSKRRRIENGNSTQKSCENLSHVRLTGVIAQYLLSRVPLPTSRIDLQKRFIKPEGSKKVDLDSILNLINDKFKSCLGLGIFGLDKTITNQTISNPKYYIVQLNRSKAHLDLVYQFGNINFKSIGELTIDQDKTHLISNRLCNSFLTFLSFLFGFFEITSSDEELAQNDSDSLNIIQNNKEIEIPIGKFELIVPQYLLIIQMI